MITFDMAVGFMAMRLFGYSCWALWICLQHFVVCVGGPLGYACQALGLLEMAVLIFGTQLWDFWIRLQGFWI